MSLATGRPTSLPVRAETGIAGAAPLTFSDYAFADDEAATENGEGGCDSASRLNELLGLTTTAADFVRVEEFGSAPAGGKGSTSNGACVGGSGIDGKLGGADRGSVAKPIRGQQNPKTTTTAPSAAGGDDRTILYAAGAAVVAVVVAIVLMSQ
jgi:hypothetical protein